MTIPKNWEQLTPAQAFSAVKHSLKGKNTASKMQILEAVLPFDMLPIYAKLKADKIKPLLKLIDWVFEKPILKPHVQEFIVDDIKFLLPDAFFKNVHLIEFSYASDAYNDMVTQKNQKALDKLIACLCRPEQLDVNRLSPNYSGDPREKFNPELLDTYATKIQNLPIEFKCYFIKYFESCADHIVAQFKLLFSPATENTEGGRFKQQTPNFGWLGFIMSLADTGVFGNFEQTQFTNMYTALAYRLKKFYDEKELK